MIDQPAYKPLVLHVLASMDPTMGGVCQAVRTMIKGFEQVDVFGSEVVCLDSSEVAELEEDLFPIHKLGPKRGPWSYSPQLVPWLVENLSRFDVVIIHGLWLYHSYAVRKALGKLKQGPSATTQIPRCFVMPHGMLDPYFQRDPSRRLKALRNWVYWKLIEHKVVNEASAVLFTCEEELRLAAEYFRPYKPKEGFVIGLGVDEPPAFNPLMGTAFSDRCPELGEQPYLLFLSRIHPKKGVDLLIRAYATLADAGKQELEIDRLPDLVIAGPLDSDYASEMRVLAEELLPSSDLAPRIHFPGMLSGDAKWGAFYGSEAFVLPSHQENFGIAVVEALACGKPVMISNKVNIWREIEQSGGGIVMDDALVPIKGSLERWCTMKLEEKTLFSARATEVFKQLYNVQMAALRLLSTLSEKRETNDIL
ncbi:glycosyltransferase [Luteolibacter sp. AS25]|uniref:glycosyltransferase n=1 Tax=Luteolibacter sp. AS25 TaxID=3135776 RepID=UPI00398A694E